MAASNYYFFHYRSATERAHKWPGAKWRLRQYIPGPDDWTRTQVDLAFIKANYDAGACMVYHSYFCYLDTTADDAIILGYLTGPRGYEEE